MDKLCARWCSQIESIIFLCCRQRNPNPEGKQIMLGTRFTEFLALSVDPRVGISRSASRPMFDYFSYL